MPGKRKRKVKADTAHRMPSQILGLPISQPTSVTDFFTEHLLSCPPEYEEADNAAALRKAEETLQLDLGLAATDIAALREDCALQTLRCDEEGQILESQLALRVPDTFGLETTRRLHAALDNDAVQKTYDAARRHRRIPTDLTYLNSRDQGSTELVGEAYLKDTILTVLVMKPLHTMATPRVSHARISQRLEVLGRQSLCDLRDRITCSLDDAILGDCSDCLDNLPSVTAKDVYPSSYFYIEGTFFSDLRQPGQRDISEPVREWIAAKPQRCAQWGQPEAARMDETVFRDLTLRLGAPNLFVHLGDCEHIIVFSDLRMMAPHDCQDPRRYPLQTGYVVDRARHCKVCQRVQSRWGAHGSDSLPEDPTFLCDACLRLFLYDEDGRKKDPRLRVYSVARILHVL